MIIGDRLRLLSESKKLSQGDIEKRTGLLRCYISRVENNHTVPALETLEKLAGAMEIPPYQLFYEGKNPPKIPESLGRSTPREEGNTKEVRYLRRLCDHIGKLKEPDRRLLLFVASKMANR